MLPWQIAAPCGPSNYKQLFAREMDRYLDMWNLMAYGEGSRITNNERVLTLFQIMLGHGRKLRIIWRTFTKGISTRTRLSSGIKVKASRPTN